MKSHTIREVERVVKEYDPEFDMLPREFPQVDWVDARLAEAILEMAEEIELLKGEIKNLKEQK
jgi:hypothetical protein